MPSAEIVAIGTELLLGEIQDLNTSYLAKFFRNINIDVYRATIIGDNSNRISGLIEEALSRCDMVITTGGLGPTVDDPTRQSVAKALGVDLEYRPDLWLQIEERFKRYGRPPSENNRRQAYIPQNAIPVENKVGTAPAFICEVGKKCIISLPGVPNELAYLCENAVLPYISNKFGISGIIKVRVLHTVGIGESLVDEKVSDFELLSNPTVGLLAHPGQTDIRITAKANTAQEADAMIKDIELKIYDRLGDNIYGVDDEQLGSLVQSLLNKKHFNLEVIENGFKNIQNNFSGFGLTQVTIQPVQELPNNDPFSNPTTNLNSNQTIRMLLNLQQKGMTTEILLKLIYKDQIEEKVLTYGGPSDNAPIWAVNNALNLLHRFLTRI